MPSKEKDFPGYIPDTFLLARLRLVVMMIALLIALAAITVFAGWSFNIGPLKSIWPGIAAMKPNTTICLLLGAFCVLLLVSHPRSARNGVLLCAIMIVFISGLTLLEYILRSDFQIDLLILGERIAHQPSSAIRMAPSTALCFFLLGPAIISRATRHAVKIGNFLAMLSGFIALLFFIGYLHGVQSLFRIGTHSDMTLYTSVALIFLALALLMSHPEVSYLPLLASKTAGGMMVRRLLPAAILIPIGIGWLRLLGEKAGYYDTVLGPAFMVITTICIYSMVIWICAKKIDEVEQDHKISDKISLTDELTDLYSRRGFLLLVEHELKVCRHYKREAALVFIELGGLRMIGDLLGHQIADLAISDTAKILNDSFRETDILGRIGADKFAVFATETNEQEVAISVDRLFGNIYRHNGQTPHPFKISLSVGIQPCHPESDAPVEEFIQKARFNMYQDKGSRKFSAR